MRLQAFVGPLGPRPALRPRDFDLGAFEKALGDFPAVGANVETDLDFWRDRLAIRRKTLSELILRGMADEESRTQGLKDRGYPTLVGLCDAVEPLDKPFDRHDRKGHG